MEINKEEFRTELIHLARQPLRDMLSILLSAKLTQEDIAAFAKRYPARP